MELSETKTRIILEAERLLAERGLNAVSLREIGATAGQKNVGGVQYHFGNRAGLIKAIFEFRMRGIESRREEMFAAVRRNGSQRALMRDLVACLVVPPAEVIEAHGPESNYLRFVVQFRAQKEAERAEILAGSRYTAVIGRKVMGELNSMLAHLPSSVRHDRLELLRSQMWHALADFEAAVAAGERHADETTPYVDTLIDYACAGLRAAPSRGRRTSAGKRRAVSGG